MNTPDEPQLVTCALCNRAIPLAKATAASAYANGRPAFGCEVHRNKPLDWMLDWVEFRFVELDSILRAAGIRTVF